MPLGAYFGAGGVKSLYRCYVGAGGVKSVSGIYIGQGGSVRRVWPSGLIYSSGVVYQPMTYTPSTSSSGVVRSSISYGSSAITISNNTSSGATVYHLDSLVTDDSFDISQYSLLTVNYNVTETTSGRNAAIYIGVGPNIPSSSGQIVANFDAYYEEAGSINTTGARTATVNLSGVTANDRVIFLIQFYGTATFTVQISHIELS